MMMRVLGRLLWLLGLSLVLAACATTAQTGPAQATPIRAMTFNIRLDTAADGPNAWPHRQNMVADLIRYEAPDVLGLQEVLLNQKQALEAALPDYAFAGVARDDGIEAGEFSPLAWRRDRFDLIDSGTFWLSPTPDVPGKAWDAALPRIATWARLRDRASGRVIRVLNTHFDHVGAEAKLRSAQLIARWAAEGGAVPTIVMGDFNSPPSSPPMAALVDAPASGLRNALSISRSAPYGPPGTFTGFRIDAAPPQPIDHILVSPGITVQRHAIVTQHWEGRLPSDHYPVVADLEIGG